MVLKLLPLVCVGSSVTSLNPTVVVLKQHLRALEPRVRRRLNPTVVVLKPDLQDCFFCWQIESQSNRSGFETVLNLLFSVVSLRLNPTVVVLKLGKSFVENKNNLVSIQP